MSKEGWWKPVVLTAILSLALGGGGFLFYGISNRAIIDYVLEAPGSIDFRYSQYLTVRLKFKNRGNTDASIILRLVVENATILGDTIESPHELVSESEAEFYYAALRNTEESVLVEVHVVPKNSTDVFTMKYTIEKRIGPLISISYIFSFIFGELHRYYPTSLTFVRVDTNNYERE